MNPKTPITVTLIIAALFALNCAATYDRKQKRFITAQIESGNAQPLVLASAKAQCKPLLKKRIVHGLYVLPIKELTAAERAKVEAAGSIRIREVMTPADIAWTAIGGLFTFVTRTRIYEQCDAKPALMTDAKKRELDAERAKMEMLRNENATLGGPGGLMADCMQKNSPKHLKNIGQISHDELK